MSKVPTVGFVSPPCLVDLSPEEIPRAVREPVRTRQASLTGTTSHVGLCSTRDFLPETLRVAAQLAGMGCDLVAQLGSPLTWAGVASESEARRRCDDIEAAAGIPVAMTGLAMVDALRAHGVRRVSVDCTYYDGVWQAAFAGFLSLCGFTVMHVSGLAEQDLGEGECALQEQALRMDRDLTRRSVLAVARAAPRAQAVVLTGSLTDSLDCMDRLEAEAGMPVVAGDLALYWAIARGLGLTLKPGIGSLAGLYA